MHLHSSKVFKYGKYAAKDVFIKLSSEDLQSLIELVVKNHFELDLNWLVIRPVWNSKEKK